MHYTDEQEEELTLELWRAAGCKKNYTKIPKFSKGELRRKRRDTARRKKERLRRRVSIISDLKVALFLAARCQRQEAISHNNREHINGLSAWAFLAVIKLRIGTDLFESWVRKIQQLFLSCRYMVGHLFFVGNLIFSCTATLARFSAAKANFMYWNSSLPLCYFCTRIGWYDIMCYFKGLPY